MLLESLASDIEKVIYETETRGCAIFTYYYRIGGM